MFRKTLTILSVLGLLLSVGLWGVSYLQLSYGKPSHAHPKLAISNGALSYWHGEPEPIIGAEVFRAIVAAAPTIQHRADIIFLDEYNDEEMSVSPTLEDLLESDRLEWEAEVHERFEEIKAKIAAVNRPLRGAEHEWMRVGCGSLRTIWRPSYSRQSQLLRIPLWIPTVLFATMFLWSFLPIRRRRKREKLGLCMKCGYDLRGSGERCPECGTAFEMDRPRLQGGE